MPVSDRTPASSVPARRAACVTPEFPAGWRHGRPQLPIASARVHRRERWRGLPRGRQHFSNNPYPDRNSIVSKSQIVKLVDQFLGVWIWAGSGGRLGSVRLVIGSAASLIKAKTRYSSM